MNKDKQKEYNVPITSDEVSLTAISEELSKKIIDIDTPLWKGRKNAPTESEIEQAINKQINDTLCWTKSATDLSFFEFEKKLIKHVFLLGQLFVSLFLAMRETDFNKNRTSQTGFKWQKPQSRTVGTFFGKVCYWRSYLYKVGGGYYPLDVELGFSRDGFSIFIQSLAVQVATKMSYAQSVLMLTMFLQWSPAQKTIEETGLGFGRYTKEWFESAPVPTGDGQILIIQIDSKANPMAKQEELDKRRGKRQPNSKSSSQRQRGKSKRQSGSKKKRRKKGDKSKNGKMATIVVMYTLEMSENGELEGPINKWVYASHAPKRHAVAIARREAIKRGFEPNDPDGRTIQIVTDGDNDLERYIRQFFPLAMHTIDVYHVVEYLWEAGHCLHREGSCELSAWVEEQKNALYEGRVCNILEEIEKQLARLSSNSNKHKRLQKVFNYINKRQAKMNYHELREQDLEISSGTVEGAVKHVIAKRFDNGGMRWIKERADSLLQLRCIEINGDWLAFIDFIQQKVQAESQQKQQNIRISCKKAVPLPDYGVG